MNRIVSFLLGIHPRRKCPRCGKELKQVAMRHKVVDKCLNCGGVWFDRSEIEVCLGLRKALEETVPYLERNWSLSSLDCPVCGEKMRQLKAGETFHCTVDICPVDQGWWIDRGELSDLQIGLSKALGTARSISVPRASALHTEGDDDNLHGLVCSFFDLSPTQKVAAFIGLPAESGRTYDWRCWVSLLLIAINVAVFLGTCTNLQTVVNAWGFTPANASSSILTYGTTVTAAMFLHGSLLHLLTNMFFLFTVGDDVEHRLGPLPYVLFYFTGGVVASTVSYLGHFGWSKPHIGASGAVAAVMGAYLILCHHKKFYCWIFRIIVLGRLIALPVWAYLLFWCGLQVLGLHAGRQGVDFLAHLGGFIFGAVVGLAVKATQRHNPISGNWEWAFLKR